MRVRVAFAGFRHLHLLDVYRAALTQPELVVVAACEEDPNVRERIQGKEGVAVTHHRNRDLIETAEFDLLVVGEVFSRRGELTLQALARGKQVLSDKPICTSLSELDAIEASACARDLAVGAVLELRDAGVFRSLRELVAGGGLGEAHAASFGGQHPLLLGSRPGWYFSPGAHGGTLNDLAIHALDLLPWVTGRRFSHIYAARCWNAGLPEHPEFRNCAQLMLGMEGGLGVIGDVSYLSPDGFGYALPMYWRFTLWGEEGVAEGGLNSRRLAVYRRDRSQPELIPAAPAAPGGYWRRLLDCLEHAETRRSANRELFEATRVALLAQQAADLGLAPMELPAGG